MTAKQVAAIVVGLGVGLLAASLLADIIGIGDDPGFGSQQTTGTVVGVSIVILGLMISRKTV